MEHNSDNLCKWVKVIADPFDMDHIKARFHEYFPISYEDIFMPCWDEPLKSWAILNIKYSLSFRRNKENLKTLLISNKMFETTLSLLKTWYIFDWLRLLLQKGSQIKVLVEKDQSNVRRYFGTMRISFVWKLLKTVVSWTHIRNDQCSSL